MTNSPRPIDSDSVAPRPLVLALALLLIAATAALYVPSLSGELVYDDLPLIEQAPATRSIQAALQRFMEPFWEFNNQDSEVQRGVWRPLTSLALAVGRTIGGGAPFGFHLVSLLLHIAGTIVAFRLGALLLRTRAGIASATRAALGGAAVAWLFAFHPAQVESVAWMSAVNDPLFGFLALWALLSYERAAQAERAPWLAALLMLLALASKETAIVVPILAVLLDVTAGRRLSSTPGRRALLALFLPLAIWYGVRVYVFGDVTAGVFRDHGDFGFSASREWTFRIELAGGFLRHLFWPDAPAVFRPVHPVLPAGSQAVLHGALWLGGTVVAAIAALVLRKRAVAFGLIGALVVIAPMVASPDRAGLFPESDRYLYLAVFGAALALIAVLARLRSALPMALVTLTAAALMGRISWAHEDTFQNEIAFRDAAVEDAPDSPNVRWGAGRAYITEYVRTQDTPTLEQAYIHYLHSLKAVTKYGDGSFVDDETRSGAERIARLENLILNTPAEKRRLDPTVFATTDDRYQATLGQIYSNLLRIDVAKTPDLDYPLRLAEGAAQILDWGKKPELASLLAQIHLRRGETQQAKEAIALAMKAAPSNPSYQAQLGQILMREGNFEGARTTFDRALELRPQDADLRLDFASAALEGGRLEIAEAAIQRVLAEDSPKNVRALVLRATLEGKRRRPTEALRYLDRALAENPNNGLAHKQRGLAMVQLNDFEGALESFSNAARLMPEDFQSHNNVASLLLRQQPGPNASESAQESWLLALEPVLVRAYMLSPPSGQEQLLLQQQLERLVGNNPDRALNLATSLRLQNRSALSLIWVNRAIEARNAWPEEERDGNLLLAYTLQGQLSREAGLAEDAVHALRNAVLIEPNHFPAQFELSDVLTALKRYDEARTPTLKALELFPEAGIAREMAAAVKGTLEQHLKLIEANSAAGPELPR
ncbi:tetratricopeptide repeat protein [Planctomycetes bacterium Poly30]|uniref:tetratricopeptide repeat protein n=1 Tax=Saltatorellus ferox TaxID=2528018 RepID=UPI0011A37DBB